MPEHFSEPALRGMARYFPALLTSYAFRAGSKTLRGLGIDPPIVWLVWGNVVLITSYWLYIKPPVTFRRWALHMGLYVTPITLLIGYGERVLRSFEPSP